MDKNQDDLFENFDELFFRFGAGEPGLPELLREGKTDQARERLEAMLQGREEWRLQRGEAEACLTAAWGCPDALFRELLELSPPGEYAVREELPWPGGAEGETADLCGTLPILAAARGETEKLRLLLERGMDPNAASFEAFEVLQTEMSGVRSTDFGFGGFRTLERLEKRQQVFGGCAVASVFLPAASDDLTATEPRFIEVEPDMIGDPEGRLICGMTPLAAAILFGRTDCVRLLLRLPGVRVAESSAVGAAALLAARGTRSQRACVRLAFNIPNTAPDPAAALTGGTLLPAQNVAAFGTPEDLRRRLTAPGTTEDEALALLGNDKLWEEAGLIAPMAKKLLTVFAARPALLRGDLGRDRLLTAGLEGLNYPWSDAAKKVMRQTGATVEVRTYGGQLLKLWRSAAGKERDVSAGLQTLGSRMSGQTLRDALERLTEGGGTLTAAAEAALGPWPELDLYALLRKVRFTRCTDRGVSALALAILDTGSLRLMRFAARAGVLAGEDRAALLCYISRSGSPAPLRAAVLALPPRETALKPLRASVPRRYWTGMDAAERDALYDACQELLTGPVSEPEARALLERLRDDRSVARSAFDDPVFSASDGAMKLRSFEAAACCADDPTLLRLARSLWDAHLDMLWEWDTFDAMSADMDCFSGAHTVLNASPLALAAAAGKPEVLRALLAEGADPDERDLPRRSVLNFFWQYQDTLMTPLALALWLGHPEAAAVLEAAGADRALAEDIVARLRTRTEPDIA